jgi:hypothetical protein
LQLCQRVEQLSPLGRAGCELQHLPPHTLHMFLALPGQQPSSHAHIHTLTTRQANCRSSSGAQPYCNAWHVRLCTQHQQWGDVRPATRRDRSTHPFRGSSMHRVLHQQMHGSCTHTAGRSMGRGRVTRPLYVADGGRGSWHPAPPTGGTGVGPAITYSTQGAWQ